MKRRLLAILAALSMFLCAATVFAWVRGHRVGDTLILGRLRGGPEERVFRFVQLWSSGGGMRILFGTIAASDPIISLPDRPFTRGTYSPGPNPYPFDRSGPPTATNRALGFEVSRRHYAIPTYRERFRSFTLPCWFLVLITMLMPLGWATGRLKARRKRRRIARGLCPDCGYDLRASKERCPECGAPVPAGHLPNVAP